MSYILYILGITITLYTLLDIIWTTLWVDGGAGWLTDRLTTGIWKRLLKSNNKMLMNISGPLILSMILFIWFFLLWLGATVFFAGDLESIVNSSNQSISWYQLPYYSGFVVFTLGIGDFTPQSTLFQIATAFYSGIGMLMLTFGASYILSIVSAVVEKRTFARNIMGIGEDSIEFIKTVWDGEDFHQLDDVLPDLNSQITQYTQQLQAFPLLQYYHSEDKEKASPVAIAVLYESLLLMRYGIEDKGLVNTTLINASLKSIHNFIEVSIEGYGDVFEEFEGTPPNPDLSRLKELDIPLTSQNEYLKKMEDLSEQRQQLQKIIMIDNHEWPTR